MKDFCVYCRTADDIRAVAAAAPSLRSRLPSKPLPVGQYIGSWDGLLTASATPFGREFGNVSDAVAFLNSLQAPWGGTGLPPVGTVCEINLTSGEWIKCTILFSGNDLIVFHDGEEERAEYSNPKCFRPIRTDRERFIEAAKKHGSVDPDEWMGSLYDAGFHLPEVKP